MYQLLVENMPVAVILDLLDNKKFSCYVQLKQCSGLNLITENAHFNDTEIHI